MAATEPAGGEQAANTLQPTGSSRHTTTANGEVETAIAALLLVNGSACLFSHGKVARGQAFGFRLTLEGRWGEAVCR